MEAPGQLPLNARRSFLRWLPLLALGLFVLVPPPALTTVPDISPAPSVTLERLEHDLMHALQARDRARLEELLSADCEITGAESAGERSDKVSYVTAALDPGVSTIDAFTFDDLSTTIVAADVAIVRATLDRRGWIRGRKAADRLLLTDVWKQRDGRWQLVSRHASRSADEDGGRTAQGRD